MKKRFKIAATETSRSLAAFPRVLIGQRSGDVGAARGLRRARMGVLALLETLLTGLALVVAGRMVVYPFLAAGASPDWLARSWGGPSAIGATVTHWVVGAAIIGVCFLAVRGVRRKSL